MCRIYRSETVLDPCRLEAGIFCCIGFIFFINFEVPAVNIKKYKSKFRKGFVIYVHSAKRLETALFRLTTYSPDDIISVPYIVALFTALSRVLCKTGDRKYRAALRQSDQRTTVPETEYLPVYLPKIFALQNEKIFSFQVERLRQTSFYGTPDVRSEHWFVSA